MSEAEKDTDYLDFSSQGGGLDDFDALYNQYYQPIYANILKLVKVPEAAEDLLQEVFLALWLNHSSIERSRVANWLFVVSYNKAISHLKKIQNSPIPFHSQELVPGEITDGITITEEEFEERLARIQEAVAHLPDRKREIFHLYRFEGMTSEEIAATLKLSVHTVKDHLKVANKSIRTYLLEKYHYTFLAEIALLVSYYFG